MTVVDRIILGAIVKPQGIRGEVKAAISFHSPEKLSEFKTVFLGGKALNILSSAVRQGYWYITFEGIDSIEKAQALRNQPITIASNELDPLPDNTFYHFELIGFEVMKPDQSPLGKVANILSHPAVDSLVIENGETKIIPLSQSIIERIDKENHLIYLKENLP